MDNENELKQLLNQYKLEKFYTKLEEEGYDCIADFTKDPFVVHTIRFL